VCWESCSSCWSLYLLREEFLSAPIHPSLWFGRFGPSQRPVYYISEVLFETKARYPQIQKLLYAVVLV
jgi:hypothetical protein